MIIQELTAKQAELVTMIADQLIEVARDQHWNKAVYYVSVKILRKRR